MLFKRLQFSSAFFMVLFMCVIYIIGYLAARTWVRWRGGGEVQRPLFEIGSTGSVRLAMGALCIAYVGSNALTKLSLNYVTMPMM